MSSFGTKTQVVLVKEEWNTIQQRRAAAILSSILSYTNLFVILMS